MCLQSSLQGPEPNLDVWRQTSEVWAAPGHVYVTEFCSAGAWAAHGRVYTTGALAASGCVYIYTQRPVLHLDVSTHYRGLWLCKVQVAINRLSILNHCFCTYWKFNLSSCIRMCLHIHSEASAAPGCFYTTEAYGFVKYRYRLIHYQYWTTVFVLIENSIYRAASGCVYIYTQRPVLHLDVSTLQRPMALLSTGID